jgi:hypothetical protein
MGSRCCSTADRECRSRRLDLTASTTH